MMLLLCIDSKNKPNEIPQSKWDLLKEGNRYTPLEYIKCTSQGGVIGVKLVEINLDDCAPYICFSINRFAIPVEIEEKVEEFEEIVV
jgi:hypothetical protein